MIELVAESDNANDLMRYMPERFRWIKLKEYEDLEVRPEEDKALHS